MQRLKLNVRAYPLSRYLEWLSFACWRVIMTELWRLRAPLSCSFYVGHMRYPRFLEQITGQPAPNLGSLVAAAESDLMKLKASFYLDLIPPPRHEFFPQKLPQPPITILHLFGLHYYSVSVRPSQVFNLWNDLASWHSERARGARPDPSSPTAAQPATHPCLSVLGVLWRAHAFLCHKEPPPPRRRRRLRGEER